MNFRSLSDLSRVIRDNLHLLPNDLDAVVGIPRSGMIPANIIALYLNIPLTTFEEFLNNRYFEGGITRKSSHKEIKSIKKVLIVDDSITTGKSINKVKSRIINIDKKINVIFLCIYATKKTKNLVDMCFELVPNPRVFEWNVLHHELINNFCFDIDGVLCPDPENHENDDALKYLNFLKNVRKNFYPSYEIGWIVSSRLEKYRTITEQWLKNNNIKYKNLILLDLPSAKERRRLKIHASFKANVYKNNLSILFIESEKDQAAEIARISGKDVLCFENMTIYKPDNLSFAKVESQLKLVINKIKLKLLRTIKFFFKRD